MNRYPYFTPANFSSFLEDVKRHLKRDEPGVIISYPASGLSWRAEQLVQDYADHFEDPIKLLTLSEKTELDTIFETIASYRYVIITNTEFAFQNGATHLIDGLIMHQRTRHSNLKLLFLSEKNIFEPTYRGMITQSTFFANVTYHALYDRKISSDFLDHMCKRWGCKLTRIEQLEIVDRCMGSIWLIKHALRLRLQYPEKTIEEILHDPTMFFRIESIWHAFTPNEQEDLSRIVQTESLQRVSLINSRYFESTGIVSRGKITIPILCTYIKSILNSHTIEISGSDIRVNNVHVNDVFSEQERDVFVLLYTNSGQPVDREQIAEVLWRDDIDEKYSPWAIEQLMRRLRKKLTNLGLPKKSIMTVRGKGYMFSDST